MKVELKDLERIDDLGGGLKIIQSSSTPCFSVDAVLLADFVRPKESAVVIDLGTGTGVIPLLLSRKIPHSRLAGIELIEQMQNQAKRSVDLNGLAGRIEIIQGDLRNAENFFGKAVADIVVANPPYYKVGEGRVNLDADFAAARSEQNCELTDIIAAAAVLLKPQGRFYLVHRAERLEEIMVKLPVYKMNPERLRTVQPYIDKDANLVLLEARKNGRGKLRIMPPLVVYASRGRYTKEMREIYGREALIGSDCHRQSRRYYPAGNQDPLASRSDRSRGYPYQRAPVEAFGYS
jgi:tRNA1Val (adenine37-N6)-methyltransferase